MASSSDDRFAYALSSNAAWAGHQANHNPQLFSKLAAGQSPKFLWLGCSDSRVPETTLLGLQPGDVFVHRNIANVVSPTDISVSAVLEYAINYLKVEHVVLCGHSCCGGAAAALGDARLGGVLDTWLTPLKQLRNKHAREIMGLEEGERAMKLAELNVKEGCGVLLANFTVHTAIKERGLKVHGVVYDIGKGMLEDLCCGNEGDLEKLDGLGEGQDK